MDVQDLGSQAADRLHDAAQDGKVRADAMLEGVALAVTEFADRIDGDTQVARLARSAADTVSGWSAAMQSKSVDDLVEDSRAAVRQSPVLAIGLAVAAGFALTRFLKASTPR
ncbi:MAG TPA: hypothetical protein PK808_03200 [Polymorphobacter sp.]|jgi:hypothetical protein|nr:hypothetical protein [Polymorphobacter sp.]